MAEKADINGNLFRKLLSSGTPQLIKTIRGRGLMNAIVMDPSSNVSAWETCLALMKNGLLAKPTHGDIIRLSPPLCITEDEIVESCDIIKTTVSSLSK